MTELNADVKRLLDRPNYAHVATLLPDGAPHTVPVWIAREGDDVVILSNTICTCTLRRDHYVLLPDGMPGRQ